MSLHSARRFFFKTILITALIGLLAGPANASTIYLGGGSEVNAGEGPDGGKISAELLGDRKGPIKVVVELTDLPVSKIYADAGGELSRNAVSLSKLQLNRIQMAQENFIQTVKRANIPAAEIYRTQRVYNGVALVLEAEDLPALAAIPEVTAIYPLISKELDHISSVPLVGALEAWANATPYQGDGIDIGIIDTGIDYTHKNFGGAGTTTAYSGNNSTLIEINSFPTAKVVGGYDFSGNNYDANGVFGLTTPAPDPDPLDCNGHGSHVAGSAAGYGIIKATGGNPAADAYGDYAPPAMSGEDFRNLFRIGPGVAPMANLYALKIFGCGGASDLTDEAIEWAVDPNQDGDLSDHLDVINLSLGSSFGSENDTSTIASNNAALAGVIVVASAGNNGDVFYITGSPGVAQRAISVAGSMDGSLVADGFGVIQTPDDANLPEGAYGSLNAGAYPWLAANSAVSGQLRYLGTGSGSGCTAFPPGAFTGTIALIDWSSLPDGSSECSSSVRTSNALAAGANGVIFAYDKTILDMTITGSAIIPATITNMATGDQLKLALVSPQNLVTPLLVRLSAEYNGTELQPYDASQNDGVYSASSRGPRRVDTGLKPDITAPGVTIFSTYARSGNQGVALSGTSMAAPHVSGAMALLRQKLPEWTVEELKALVMNVSVHDVFMDEAKTIPSNPDRSGVGRLDLSNAIQTDLIAYSLDDRGAVSVSYGFQEVVETGSTVDRTSEKSVQITNKSLDPIGVVLSFDARYPANAGVTYALYQGGTPVGTDPITVPGSGSITITIRQTINASALVRTRDEGIAELVTMGSKDYAREYLSESGGFLVVTPAGSNAGEPVLRVPVHAAHRAAGARGATGDLSLGVTDEATLTIPMAGVEVGNSDDIPRVQVLELLHENPNDTWSTGINNNADLRSVGATSDFGKYATTTSVEDVSVVLGVATFGRWSTPLEVEFQVYIDIDEDGYPDWVGVNTGASFFTGTNSDLFLSTLCPFPLPDTMAERSALCGFANTLNGDTYTPAGKINTNPYNSNVMTLVFPADWLGLSLTNTDFNFYVDTYNRNFQGLVDTTPWIRYDIARQAYDTVDYTTTQIPTWVDRGDLSLKYDKTDLYNQGGSLGLLLLHHHNAGDQAEIVSVGSNYAALVWDKYSPLSVIPGRKTVIPVRVVNETATNCTFNLSTTQAPTVWAVTFPLSQVFVPANGSYVVDATITIPADALAGSEKLITVNAICTPPDPLPIIEASNTLVLHAAYTQWMPLIGK